MKEAEQNEVRISMYDREPEAFHKAMKAFMSYVADSDKRTYDFFRDRVGFIHMYCEEHDLLSGGMKRKMIRHLCADPEDPEFTVTMNLKELDESDIEAGRFEFSCHEVSVTGDRKSVLSGHFASKDLGMRPVFQLTLCESTCQGTKQGGPQLFSHSITKVDSGERGGIKFRTGPSNCDLVEITDLKVEPKQANNNPCSDKPGDILPCRKNVNTMSGNFTVDPTQRTGALMLRFFHKS